jgi:hypothetical protein
MDVKEKYYVNVDGIELQQDFLQWWVIIIEIVNLHVITSCILNVPITFQFLLYYRLSELFAVKLTINVDSGCDSVPSVHV